MKHIRRTLGLLLTLAAGMGQLLPRTIAFAAAEGNVQEVEKFLKSGTDPNVVDEFGNTPLIMALAARRDKRRVARMLIEKGSGRYSKPSRG